MLGADCFCTLVFSAYSWVEPRVLCLPLFADVSSFTHFFFVLRCAFDIRDVEPMCRMISSRSFCTAHSLCSSEEDISLRSALSAIARDRLGHRSRAAETPFFRRGQKVRRVTDSPIRVWFGLPFFMPRWTRNVNTLKEGEIGVSA